LKAVRQAPSRGREHEFEAQPGLPEQLPEGERILWQGAPRAALVARRIFRLPALAIYFGLMLAWRVTVLLQEGAAWAEVLRGSAGLALLAAVALGILAVLARLTASTTFYTLTDKRVVMRIGIVLTVTYNLPLKQVDSADLVPLAGGAGEIALTLREGTRIAYLQLWPHARPWRLARTQPMLRCLGDGQAVSAQLAHAWALANAQPATPQAAGPAPAAVAAGRTPGLPGLGPLAGGARGA
jgi:hypothetical protein